MLIDVHIQDTATGESRVYRDDYEWSNDGGPTYMFGMGNYSCDCNRHLFFGRAIGEELYGQQECGEDRFVVEKIVERGTDRVIYQDPPFDEATIKQGYRTRPQSAA